MRKINALVVDDEKKNTDLLVHFIKTYCPAIGTLMTAHTKDEAVDLINNQNFDLCFLDIVLEEYTAFDLLDEIEVQPYIIFVSAFDRFAIDSFKFNTVDYLLKPVEIEALVEAVGRAVKRIEEQQFIGKEEIKRLEKSIQDQSQIDFITIATLNSVNLIKKSEIVYCKSSGRYTEFYLLDQKKIVASKSLGTFEAQLSSKAFFRIHNSYLINLNHLTNISKKSGNYCQMTDGPELPISRRRYEKLLHYLNIP